MSKCVLLRGAADPNLKNVINVFHQNITGSEYAEVLLSQVSLATPVRRPEIAVVEKSINYEHCSLFYYVLYHSNQPLKPLKEPSVSGQDYVQTGDKLQSQL